MCDTPLSHAKIKNRYFFLNICPKFLETIFKVNNWFNNWRMMYIKTHFFSFIPIKIKYFIEILDIFVWIDKSEKKACILTNSILFKAKCIRLINSRYLYIAGPKINLYYVYCKKPVSDLLKVFVKVFIYCHIALYYLFFFINGTFYTVLLN